MNRWFRAWSGAKKPLEERMLIDNLHLLIVKAEDTKLSVKGQQSIVCDYDSGEDHGFCRGGRGGEANMK